MPLEMLNLVAKCGQISRGTADGWNGDDDDAGVSSCHGWVEAKLGCERTSQAHLLPHQDTIYMPTPARTSTSTLSQHATRHHIPMPALTFKVNTSSLQKKRPTPDEEEDDDDRIAGLVAQKKPVKLSPLRKRVRFNNTLVLPPPFLQHKWALEDEIAASEHPLSNPKSYRPIPRSRSRREKKARPKHAMPSPARASRVKMTLSEDKMGLGAFASEGLSFGLVLSANELRVEDFYACLHLIEKTSGADYKASTIGWDEDKKEQEMGDRNMIYLLVRQDSSATATRSTSPPFAPSDDGKILGFISFMFTFDDPPHEDREVVYIYEIHLEDRLRRFGLGRTLINFVETAAAACNINKTMLTVFTANQKARALYEKLGYTKDECSPKDRVTRKKTIEADYVILSKSLTPLEEQEESVSAEG